MHILSRIAAVLAVALGFAALGSAASAGEILASKASFAAERDGSLLLSVSDKPCCYSHRTGQYYRYSTKTCWRVGGRIVDDRYCRYDGNWRDDRWRDDRWRDDRWRDGGWNNGNGYALCCKRGRKEWWVRSREECWQRRAGQIVHPSYCVRH